jgi:spermidine synthase
VVAASRLPLRYLGVPLVLGALLLLPPPGRVKAVDGSARVLHETETRYQYVRVIEESDGTRRLELNEGVATHSQLVPGSYLADGYWDHFLVLPRAALPRAPRSVAILGNAAGTTARAYGHYFPRTRVDAVELDGELTSIGRRYFDLRGPRLHTVTADARPFLRHTKRRYDAIFLDAYRQPYIPFYLTTHEFFRLCRERLAANGVVIVNVGHPDGDERLERSVSATLRSVFPTVLRDPFDRTNTLVIASTAPADRLRLLAARDLMPSELRGLATETARRLRPHLPGGSVWTDDRAPVEWLVDESLLDYAAGAR